MEEQADTPPEAADELRRTEARFRSLVAASQLDVWRVDGSGRLVSDMPGWRDVTGQRPEEIAGAGWLRGVHPDDRERVWTTWERAVRDGAPYECEYRLSTVRGEDRRVLARAIPVIENGEVREWVGISTDVTELRRSEEELAEEIGRTELLHEIGQALSAELELESLVQVLTDLTTRLTGAQFGAFFYNARDENGDVYLLNTLSGAPKEAFEGFGMPRVTPLFAPTFGGEGPVLLDDVTQDLRYGKNPPRAGMPEGHLPVRSYLAVPVVSRTGEVHGGLFFGHEQPGMFTERHQWLVVGVAGQAAIALDNARLYEAERAARAESEAAARALSLLAAIGDELSADLDVDRTAERVTTLLVPDLADWAAVHLLEETQVRLASITHREPGVELEIRGLLERFPTTLDAAQGPGAAMRTGQPQLLPDIPDEILVAHAHSEEHLRLLRRLRLRSAVAVPLVARERVVGAVTLVREQGESYDADELALVEEIARRAALALDNATLYSRERTAALMLQRSLLPQGKPSVRGADIATRYLPGAEGAEVGGDWYDVLPLEDGRVVIVVGDVQGRGVPAAAVMGQLRSTVRAYALDGHEPAEVLRRVDRVMATLDEPPLTTCVLGVFDPSSDVLQVATAGHLPPLVVCPRGKATYPDLDPGAPLGVGGVRFNQQALRLEPGTQVVLFTDGLVEGPSRPLDEGLEALAAAASEAVARGAEPDALADALIGALRADGEHDDVALLVLATVGDAGAAGVQAERWEDLPVDPASVALARRTVGEVTEAMGPGELADTAALLVSEIVTNAVRHAAGSVRLHVQTTPSRLRVEVHDDAPDRLPTLRHDRLGQGEALLAESGRGLLLVEALADAWGTDLGPGSKCVWFELSGR